MQHSNSQLSDGRFWYYSVCLLNGAVAIGYGFILSLFAEFKDNFGFNETEIGFIAGIGFLAGFAGQFSLSRFADRGYSSFMIRTGLMLSVAATLWMGFGESFLVFFFGRALLGVAEAMVSPAVRRLIISRSPENVGSNLGKLAGYELAGFAIGPILGAVLANQLGIHAPFFTLAGVYAAFALFSLCVSLGSSAVPSGNKKVIRELIKIPGVQVGLIMRVALFATVGAFEVSWALYLDEAGASTWLIGVGISLFAMPLIFLAPIGGKLAQRLGSTRVMTYSILMATICMLSYGFTPWLYLLLVVSVLHAISDAITYPATQVAVALSCPPEYTASGQGLLSATGLLVAGVISAAGGAIYHSAGPKVLYISTAVIMLICVGLSRHFQSRQYTTP